MLGGAIAPLAPPPHSDAYGKAKSCSAQREEAWSSYHLLRCTTIVELWKELLLKLKVDGINLLLLMSRNALQNPVMHEQIEYGKYYVPKWLHNLAFARN